MIEKLMRKYALSRQGAKDLVKGCLACVLQNLSFMPPVALLYFMVNDLMAETITGRENLVLYNRNSALPGVYRIRSIVAV